MDLRTFKLGPYWNLKAAGFILLVGSLITALPQCTGQRHILLPLVFYAALFTAVAPYVRQTYRTTVEIGRQERRALCIYAGVCPECGYSLYASNERCPECGTPISAEAVAVMTAPDRLRFRPDVSDGVKAAISAAYGEAAGMGHDYLGTEHVLLGLLQAGGCGGTMDVAMVRDQVVALVGKGEARELAQGIPVTRAVVRVLGRAFDLYRREGTQAMLPRHLLEALRGEAGCVAAEILAGMDAEEHAGGTPA